MVRSEAKLRVSNHETADKTLASKLFPAGLVVLARSSNPIPFRTRPLIFSALMVLSLKTWESKSLPGLPGTVCSLHDVEPVSTPDSVECLDAEKPPRKYPGGFSFVSAIRSETVSLYFAREAAARALASISGRCAGLGMAALPKFPLDSI